MQDDSINQKGYIISGNEQIGVSGYECLTEAVCESRDLKLEHISLSYCDINEQLWNNFGTTLQDDSIIRKVIILDGN